MKKYLLILLMLILPVQYAWSAAAVYCQHEQRAPAHFGHHAHEHKAGSGETGSHAKANVADNDCEYCHLFSHAFFIPFSARPLLPVEPGYDVPGSLPYTSHVSRRPPRPNWSRIA